MKTGLVVAAVLCAGLARAGDESLLPLRTWTTNIFVTKLLSADFDGNGRQEIVSFSTTEGPTTMDVFGLGPHGDVLKQTTLSPNGYGDGAAADFDGDGLQDLAMANWVNSVVVYRGSPDGTPVLWKTIATAGIGFGSVAVADFNDDTWPDILVSDSGGTSTKPLLFLRNTAGTGFQVLTAISATGWNVGDLALADLNADGNLDVVASERSFDRVRVLLAEASGTTFASLNTFVVADEPQDIRALDLTADGLTDVAVAVGGAAPGLSCLAGTGGGSFGAASTAPAAGSWSVMDSGDIDGDGDTDLVLGTNGHFTYGFVNAGAMPLAAPSTLRTMFDAPSVLMTDVNGDGWRDLVTGPASGSNLTLGYGGPQGLQLPTLTPLNTEPITLHAADFTGDGQADILSLGGSNGTRLSLADGHGDGSFGDPVHTNIVLSVNGKQSTTGLCNDDDLLDVVILSTVTGGGTNVRLCLGTGASKHFTPVGQAGTGTAPVAGPLAADLDGDGTVEVCVPTGDGVVNVWRVNALSQLIAAGIYPVPEAGTAFQSWDPSTAGDLNEDGALDLVFPVASLQRVFVLPGRAGGSLGAATILEDDAATNVNCAHVVDLDEDGLLDVLGTGLNQHTTVWRGQPGLNFDAPQTTTDGSRTSQCADIDGDGHLDLVGIRPSFSYYPSTILVQRGLGNGQFRPGLGFSTTGTRLALADFTSDGVLDVVASGNVVASSSYPPDADQVSLHVTQPYTPFDNLGYALGGSKGEPEFLAWGWLKPGQVVQLSVARAAKLAPAIMIVGVGQALLPLKGGTLVPSPGIVLPDFVTDALGRIHLDMPWPPAVPSGLELAMQWWIQDAAGPKGYAASDGLTAITP